MYVDAVGIAYEGIHAAVSFHRFFSKNKGGPGLGKVIYEFRSFDEKS